MRDEMAIQNPKLRKFMEEITNDLVEKYPGEIISFILFGSATTGEWIQGKSDIDCIIVIKTKKLCQEVEDYLNCRLVELDSKYHLQLADTCTTHKKTNNLALDLIFKTESKMMFGKPFYVVAEEQLDFKEFLIKKDIKVEIGTRTIASFGLFLKRIKNTGIILYGKDYRNQIPKKMPVIEKVKASFNAMLLLMMSYVIFPFSRKSAFSHAVKANFWACDDVLFAFDRPLSTTKEEIKELFSIFDETEVDANHLQRSLHYKNEKDSMSLEKRFVFKYILKSTSFVYGLYAQAMKKLLSGKA